MTVTDSVATRAENDRPLGGIDRIFGGEGDDILAGGAYGDDIDGEAGADLLFGDNVTLANTGDGTNPRFRAFEP